jgi:hypothetical protein
MDVKSRQIGWEIWWARYWAKRFKHRPKIQSIEVRYGISRQQANAHAKKITKAMSVVLESFDGDPSKLFEETLRKYPVNDDGKGLAEIDLETGEFISGARRWDTAASMIEDACEDPDHPMHGILKHAIKLANVELETLLQMRPECEADRKRIDARLGTLCSLTQINREAGRPKNP